MDTEEATYLTEFAVERPPYWRLTFKGMRGRPDVGQLDIRGYLFTKGVPQHVPEPEARAILGRTQYEFDVEREE